MTSYERELRRGFIWAIALSAALHALLMALFDLSPGTWRPGLAPAIRAELRAVPADGELGGTGNASASAARRPGIEGSRVQAGSSLPLVPRYYRNNEVDRQAVPVSTGALVYPELAYVSKLEGLVKARVYISESGVVESVEIVDVAPRRGIFEEAALEALRQVRYRPAELAGERVRSQKLIEVKFNPRGDEPELN